MAHQVIDDDAPELDDEWFAKAKPAREVMAAETQASFNKGGRPKSDNPKVPVSLRLDADVLNAFKAQGEGWQTRMNDALRATVFPTKKQAVKAARKMAMEGAPTRGGSSLGGKLPARTAASVQVGRTKAAPGSRLKKR